MIIPDKLYTSFGQINFLPGAYSIHLVESKDTDSLALDPPKRASNETETMSEKEEIRKWYKAGSLMINWEFRETHRVSREPIVEHIESFPRLSMLFLLFSLLSAGSFFSFLDNIYKRIYDVVGTESQPEISFLKFGLLLILITVSIILVIYVIINLKNYAFHEIKTPAEMAFYLYNFCLSTIISMFMVFPLARVLADFLFMIEEKPWYYPSIGSFIIILMCSFTLVYKKTPWVRERKFKKGYLLGSLPIFGSLLIAAGTFFWGFSLQDIFVLWAILSTISTAVVLRIAIGV